MAYDPLTYIPGVTTAAGNGANTQPAPRAGDGGAKEDRPDYTCDTYREMEPRWTLCADLRTGTERVREKAAEYLPRFEAESVRDWEARIGMTFVNDHYQQTIEDLVGLACAEDVALDPKTAPPELVPLMENVDGEGNALAVFARQFLDYAIDEGHAAILTDYPDTIAIRDELARDLTLADTRERNIRPYWAAYKASDILSWRWVKLGSVHVLQKVVLRERVTKTIGAYGSATAERYRVLEQVALLGANGEATSMGAITYSVYEKSSTKDGPSFVEVGGGSIVGPNRIPLRIAYGGTRTSRLHTRPFCFGLAMTNIEEAQVQSDYASIMHKCNVPTPVFKGRPMGADGTYATVQMGQGIDVGPDGDAKMLEPSGAALNATRQRLQDIQEQLRRQGATTHVDSADAKTAAEVRIAARQRNAKLAKAARSLRDALEGAGADMLAFLGVAPPTGGKVGFVVNTDFAEGSFDPLFVAACRDARAMGDMSLEDYLYVLKNGELPDTFDPEYAAELLAVADQARADAEADPNAADDPNSAEPNAETTTESPPPPAAAAARRGAPGSGVEVPASRDASKPDRTPAESRPVVPATAGASPSPAAIDLAPIESQLAALAAQVQTLAERVAQPVTPVAASAAAPVSVIPPELMALITLIAARLAQGPAPFPGMTITRSDGTSSKVEPTPPESVSDG